MTCWENSIFPFSIPFGQILINFIKLLPWNGQSILFQKMYNEYSQISKIICRVNDMLWEQNSIFPDCIPFWQFSQIINLIIPWNRQSLQFQICTMNISKYVYNLESMTSFFFPYCKLIWHIFSNMTDISLVEVMPIIPGLPLATHKAAPLLDTEPKGKPKLWLNSIFGAENAIVCCKP